jgi:arylsulfatase A-like enzyme
VVVIDTLRADHLSHYGYHRPTAVALDEFAATATRFEDCTAPASWTVPSVASLMTGVHPTRHQLHRLGFALPGDLETMAESLSRGGWHTTAISFNPAVRPELGFDRGFDEFDAHEGKFTSYPNMEEMVTRVDAWLDHGPPQPFFLYLQPMNVHGPYRVPDSARTTLLGRPPGDEFRYFREPMRGIMREARLELRDDVGPEYLQSLVDKYDTAVRYTTDQLANLFDGLAARKLFDDTLIVVTADHGEELFDHGGFNHGCSLHREVLQVPLYLKMPGQRRGQTVDAPVDLIDLVPTILDVAGVSLRQQADGNSLLPLLGGGARPEWLEKRVRFSHTHWRNHFIGSAVTGGGHKLIRIDSNYEGLQNRWRLYDLIRDPGERVDLYERETETAQRLRTLLETVESQLETRVFADPEDRRHTLDSSQEQLRALGYVE